MSSITGRRGAAAGTLLIVLMLSLPAQGQALLAGGGINPNGGASSPSSYLPSLGATTTTSPGSPSSYYPPYYPNYYGKWGGYLMGVSSVYQSQGQYQVDSAKAKILNEKALQDAVDTRRKVFDQWMYERNNMPSMQDMREREQKNRVRRALTDPPVLEITSGQSLNTLLKLAVLAVDSNPTGMPRIPLSQEVVAKLNIANPASGNGLGAIKGIRAGQKLDWPPVLQSANYSEDSRKLDELLREAVEDAANSGKVNVNTIQKIQAAFSNMVLRLDNDIDHISPDQYFAGRRFLTQLEGSIKALQEKNVDKFFARLDKVRTVTDLVKEMQGHIFAPAGAGDDAAYVALHQALAAYVMQIQASLPQEK